jgi:DNA (cytosine-5)-methyltransferase 1
MKFIDLFCGIGGFRIGFERNGFECVFSSDFNKNVQDTYEDNFGERPFGDITQINPDEIPDFDVLLGGFPCQPFSISGKKMGFEDTRGTLFFDICRIIETKSPSVIVLENVQHLIHHDEKRTFTVIVNSLKKLGYNITYKVLNTKDFGVPQNRERIFIIGTKFGYFDFDKLEKKPSKPLKYFLDQDGKFEYLQPEEFTLLEPHLVKKQPQSGLIFIGYRNKEGFKNGIRPNTLHLNRVHRQPNRIYSTDGFHPTIPSQETSGRFFIFIPEEKRVRKLTIDECYRIMGFPDNYKKNKNNGEKYKQIGNSVCVNITSEISRQILIQGLLNHQQNESQREIIGDLRELQFN